MIKKSDYNWNKEKNVKSVVAGILIEKDKILLEKRAIGIKESGKWSLPGGHIEIGEKAIYSLKREIKEEIGPIAEKIKFLEYYDEYISRLKTHFLVLVFSFKSRGKIKIDNSEVSEARWHERKELKKLNLAFEHKKIILGFWRQ